MQGWLMEQSSASSVLPVVENAMEQEQYIQSENQIWLGLWSNTVLSMGSKIDTSLKHRQSNQTT